MTPLGFRFAAGYAGIRKHPDDDLALMVSDAPACAAGVFTQNQVRAAPVTLSIEHLEQTSGICRAIVANAGNANCATPTMHKVARLTAKAASKLLKVRLRKILLASTGVIGEPLDETQIIDALPELHKALAPEGFEAAAAAIMTTDTYPKTATAQVETDRGVVRLAGMAKGAGMIHPKMATMLGFLFTDASIPVGPLNEMLRTAVEQTFNRISVDGDTSTNDTVFLMANGASKVRMKDMNRGRFQQALNELAQQLAVGIVGDGEGSKKVLTINIEGASDDESAVKIARAIANSPLVKTALAGSDPNWGRILSSAGAAGVEFDPRKVDLTLNGHLICRGGMRADFSEKEVQATLQLDESTLDFRIRGRGKGKTRFWTCDLTKEYIEINADYRS